LRVAFDGLSLPATKESSCGKRCYDLFLFGTYLLEHVFCLSAAGDLLDAMRAPLKFQNNDQ
jgi:hypothetical protein